LREFMFVRIADDQADAGQCGNLFGGALRVASCHYDLSVGILTADAADSGARILIGTCGNGAGVHHNYGSLSGSGGASHSALFELTFEGGTVRLGGAAAKIFYIVSGHDPMVTQTAALPREGKIKSRGRDPFDSAQGGYPLHRLAGRPLGRGRSPPALKTFSAEHRSALGGTERDGGLFSASRTGGLGFNLGVAVGLSGRRRCAEDGDALGLAGLAALRLVLELLVVKEKLFPGSEGKITPTVDTLQHLVLKFH
jgi:hypothetical protein